MTAHTPPTDLSTSTALSISRRIAPDVEEQAEKSNIVHLTVPTRPVLDMETVAEARSILKNQFSGMIETFIENCHDRIHEIEAAMENNDAGGLVRPAHTLKATCLQMGASQLAEAAMAVEYAAKALVKDIEAQPDVEARSLSVIRRYVTELPAHLRDVQDAFSSLPDSKEGSR